MDNQESPPITESLRNSDARDYIKSERFIKTAQSLDTTSDNDWLLVTPGIGRLLSEDDNGFLLTGMTRIKGQEPAYGLYLVFSDKVNGESGSMHINLLDKGEPELIVDMLREVTIKLPSEARFTVAKRFQDSAATIERSSLSEVSSLSCSIVIDQLSDMGPETSDLEEFVKGLVDSGKEGPNEEQVSMLTDYLTLVGSKLDANQMNDLLIKLKEDSQFTWEMFGVNYPYAYTIILGMVLEKRSDLGESFDSLQPKIPHQRFPLESLVKTPVETVEDVRKRLSSMPTENPPDLWLNERSRASAEIVELDNVVGGGYSGSFLLEEGTRGAKHIFKISQALAEGSMDIDGGGMTIDMMEYKGKYYVSNDGRHRVAALKALGVPYSPMLVSHIKEEKDSDLESSVYGKQ